MDKIEKTENLIKKLKKIAKQSIEKKHYEKALVSLSSCAYILYEYNQRYKDDEIEDMLLLIGESLVTIRKDLKSDSQKDVKTVLFYDGFGLDSRGLAITLTRAIAVNGYKLIYVTKSSSKNNQPLLQQELMNLDVQYVYIDFSTKYTIQVEMLNKVFTKYEPEAAYFYTTPWDVSGTVVFNQYKGYVDRYLIDLTDHAFWIGLNAFDFCNNYREMGASIEHYYRGIPCEKIIRIRGTIYINDTTEGEPLPFDTKKYRYVFSGGSLYKTLGDQDNKFYKAVSHIIETYNDINFVYVGEGDTSELERLTEQYPKRVYYFHERVDFYNLIKGSIFYLNTYPMFGGLMMKYAAYANKIPVTLRHNNDSDGLLPEQEKMGIEFDTYDEWINEIDRLILDEKYRILKENVLKSVVFTKEQEAELNKKIIETHDSGLEVELTEFDTKEFRNEYIERLNFRKLRNQALVERNKLCLFANFPSTFLNEIIKRAVKKLIK